MNISSNANVDRAWEGSKRLTEIGLTKKDNEKEK